jgi:ABC-type glycerol-3-phosphate transport system substrate-binding protein
VLAVALVAVACGGGSDAGAVDEITVDWAYYNPVSLVLREKGWLEEELEGVEVNWVQSFSPGSTAPRSGQYTPTRSRSGLPW